jgi:predicted transcriptional regulator
MIGSETKPTFREMGAEVKLSVGAVQSRVKALKNAGLIEHPEENKFRAFTLTDAGKEALTQQ